MRQKISKKILFLLLLYIFGSMHSIFLFFQPVLKFFFQRRFFFTSQKHSIAIIYFNSTQSTDNFRPSLAFCFHAKSKCERRHATRKLGNSNVLYCIMRNPFRRTRCETSSYQRVSYLETKTSEEWIVIYFGKL